MSNGKAHTYGMTKSGKVYAWGENNRGQLGLGGKDKIHYRFSPSLLSPPKGEQWKKVICGENHSLGITKKNNLYVWGDNFHNQLGFESKLKQFYSPELLNPPEGEKWDKIITRTNTSFAFTQNNKLYGWGDNRSRQ